MAIICKPAVTFPEYVVTQHDFLAALRSYYAGVEKLELKLRLAANTTVQKRYFVSPLEQLLIHEGIEARVQRYLSSGLSLALRAIERAFENAQVRASEITHFIVTSCTIPGVLLPALDAYIVNACSLPFDVRRLPISQMGCQAGVTAMAQAFHYLRGNPHENVLIVSLEICSLNEQPGDTDASAFVSRGLFGDGCAAVVVRGDRKATGLQVMATKQFLVPDTISHMQYHLDHKGNHFGTNREVVPGLKRGFPAIEAFLSTSGGHQANDLAFLVSHTGGPRVMDAVISELHLPEPLIAVSRESLREVGNLSSASVSHVMGLTFGPHYRPSHGDLGLVLGFGPGSTIEMMLVQWQESRCTDL